MDFGVQVHVCTIHGYCSRGTIPSTPSPYTYINRGEGAPQRRYNIVLAVCGAPSTVPSLGHIFAMLGRSPTEIASPSPSPCRRATRTHPLPRRLAGSRSRGRHRAEHVLNAEVMYVRYSVDWIVKLFDDINRVVLTLPLTIYKGT